MVVRRSRDHISFRHPLATTSAHLYSPMSSKWQNMTAKRGRATEEPARRYDQDKFFNESAAEKFSLISKNDHSFRKRGFTTPRISSTKGWRALYQPPRPTATSVVREFYANLSSHVLKKVRVSGVLVDFSAYSINRY